MKSEELCFWYECGKPIATTETNDGLKFCQEHADERDKYIKDGNAKRIVKFWVKAHGSKERLVKRMMGENA